jgi:hypothetical protein
MKKKSDQQKTVITENHGVTTRVCQALGGEWVPCERGFECVVEKRVNVPWRERAFPSATAFFSRHCPSCCALGRPVFSVPFLFCCRRARAGRSCVSHRSSGREGGGRKKKIVQGKKIAGIK